jgi:hypothetical protein
VFITDKAAAVVLLAYLIVEPYNRQAAGLACVAADASYAKFSGGFGSTYTCGALPRFAVDQRGGWRFLAISFFFILVVIVFGFLLF